jgi:hypothetical protein
MSTDNVANPITTNSKIVEVTPTLDTNAYASGDRLGSVMTISGAVRRTGLEAFLCDVVVVDKAKQSQSIDILFFKSSPTVASSDNAAIDISDAEMGDKFIGRVSVLTTDYTALANNSEASPAPYNRLLSADEGKTDIYALAVCRSGTPTYAANSLVFKFKFIQD